jgi:hypothetical protein
MAAASGDSAPGAATEPASVDVAAPPEVAARSQPDAAPVAIGAAENAGARRPGWRCYG